MSNESEFRKDLESLLNRYSLEKGSDTPDFVLAHYLVLSLAAFDSALNMREGWYGLPKINLDEA